MHYIVNNNLTIKSENAAKSIKQPNKVVLEYIDTLPYDSMVLDYGCGKFRYTIPICKRVKSVVSIDSKEQIYRYQTINGIRTTLVKYASQNLGNVNVFDIDDYRWRNYKYNFVFCTNVLSAIPHYEIRVNVLKRIKSVLDSKGKALICVQYRNSYFNSYAYRNNCLKYNDGWIIKNRGNYAFYGLIKPNELHSLCLSAGLSILEIKKCDGSVYIIAC